MTILIKRYTAKSSEWVVGDAWRVQKWGKPSRDRCLLTLQPVLKPPHCRCCRRRCCRPRYREWVCGRTRRLWQGDAIWEGVPPVRYLPAQLSLGVRKPGGRSRPNPGGQNSIFQTPSLTTVSCPRRTLPLRSCVSLLLSLTDPIPLSLRLFQCKQPLTIAIQPSYVNPRRCYRGCCLLLAILSSLESSLH